MEETGKSVQKCIGFDTEEVVATTYVADTLDEAGTAAAADTVKDAGTAAVKEADTAVKEADTAVKEADTADVKEVDTAVKEVDTAVKETEKTNHLRIVVANASTENCQTLGYTVYWDAQLSKSQTSHELPSPAKP